ncbi:MAG: hypothetical protein ACREGF_02555 [Candidatus Saccharimonadales bacterium]
MTTVLNVKIDDRLKKQAQAVAKTIGLPMSIVVAASLREFVRTRTITISDPPRIRPEVEAELLKVSADAKRGINVSPAFSNLYDARKWLDAHRDDD